MKQKPKYLVVYRCAACGMESGHSDIETPTCHYCDAENGLTVVSKDIITPELLAARMKASTDNMMNALRSAYDTMPEEDKALGPDGEDIEKQLLELMAKAQKFRENIHNLELRTPEEEE